MMKHFTSLLTLYMLNLFAASEVFPQTAQTYLIAAEKAANWLTSMENEEQNCNGLSWPTSELNDDATPGLCNGAAGIGRFFLKLYQIKGEESYLDVESYLEKAMKRS